MPKIPSAESITRKIPRISTGIVGIDVSDATGDLSGISGALKGIIKEQDEYESSKAEIDFLTLKNQQDRAYEQDEEYKTFDERYTSELNKGLGKTALSISDPAIRAKFINKGKLRIEQGRSRIQDLSFNKERDFERSVVNDDLNNLREVALSGQIDDVAEARTAAGKRLDAAVKLGYYSHEEAGKLKKAWRDDAAIGRLKTMAPEDRLEALNQSWAKDLPTDTLAVLIRQAEEANIINKAVMTVDDYLFNGYDRDEALEKSSKIKDVKLRGAVEKRFDYAFGKQQQAETEERSDLFEKYFLPIRQGELVIDEIPVEDLVMMSPAQQQNLFNAQANSVKSPRTTSDRTVLDTLHLFNERKQYRLLREYFIANSDKLNDTAFNTWSKVTQDGAMPVEVKSLLTVQQNMTAKLDGAQITDKGAESKLADSLDDWYMYYQQLNNKLPTDEEVDKQMDRLILKFDASPGTAWNPFNWGGEKPIFEMDSDEKAAVLKGIQQSDPEMFNALQKLYSDRNIDPTPEEFMEAYQRAIE